MGRARSLLFVPGNRADRFDRAAGAGADVVVLDLEDAVEVSAKGVARDAVAGWLVTGGEAVVRVNPVTSPYFHDDSSALAGLPGLLGIMLPKADAEALELAAARCPGVPLVPLVESARGVHEVHRVAAGHGVVRLAFGAIDLALDLMMEESPESLLLARSSLVLASRVAGLDPPADGVTTRLDDGESARLDAQAARALGFGGKLCIHPTQVPVVNAAFSPTADELRWAEGVLAALPGGAVRHGNHMIDAPLRDRARRIVARASALGEADGGAVVP
jgi:citrate lyase subunit beta/citryl-CoA lyase